MQQVRRRLTYANVVATLALAIAVSGGTAIAASQLARNSVGPRHLKANSVGAKHIKRNAVATAELRRNSITTPKIRNGAITPAKLSPTTAAALAGTPPPSTGNLPSGQTIYGTFAVGGTAIESEITMLGSISYNWRIPGQQVHFVEHWSSSSICTGSAAQPTAPPGHTCIYEELSENVSENRGHGTANPYGVSLFASSGNAGDFASIGTWAATAK